MTPHKGGCSHAAATAPLGSLHPHSPISAVGRAAPAEPRVSPSGLRQPLCPRAGRRSGGVASGGGNLRASSGCGEPSGQGALPRTPFAAALRWEEKLPSFPRSPTHFNELSGGTPPRRLPRIRPPGSPAPCKEASGGGWTLAGREDGHDPLGFFGRGLRRAQPSAPSPEAALSPAGDAGGSRPFSLPRALTGTGKFGRHVS